MLNSPELSLCFKVFLFAVMVFSITEYAIISTIPTPICAGVIILASLAALMVAVYIVKRRAHCPMCKKPN